MKFDRYDIFARALPAVLASVPFFILHYFLFSPALGAFWGELLGLKVASDVTFVFALLFLAMQFNRIVSKEVFEKRMYGDGLKFPTTNFLLHLDSYFSSDYTQKIHNRIESDFSINIPTRYSETKDEDKSRKLIAEAISHIRVKVGKGNLLGQHNLEYGFVRNFSGGNVLASAVSMLDIIIFKWIYPNNTALSVSIVSFFIYFTLSLLAGKMIESVGRSYAKVLIQEYMALQ
ncbi:hypothetical protein A2422_03050 [Candidatus Woesebacteria bacterium RIFOXYC1_FULL_31_51]|nr:MAG: hypothetical protein UR17_C0001G0115 [Candidatus Woesebacteria bacterium GW2011_GWF1_31_35]KKP23391.1 MAG: hypothetical protein UR11_C0001G0365 [Candidatus Woesebacteria bacterium GW2011_GWC1_30_29]KKP25205.1 MAG: hypothetical protein UR13_C0010G0007 [Candidatus Woesebacteria bacterium GW2011_GWD1_31_12]KKP27650.1 MAG: hypothetical protein UR16_C0003G0310 [Candidatus Woesebacteria bacterium GW2011_GWB1_31_29]KKP34293.1 MAG: hypothetical protein UR24_C0001G0358 [Candidatus Woesebacteria 